MNTTESIFTKTEKEYKAMDKLYAEKRNLFDALTAIAEIGEYGTDKWFATWEKYKTVFKKLHGYNPHWAR